MGAARTQSLKFLKIFSFHVITFHRVFTFSKTLHRRVERTKTQLLVYHLSLFTSILPLFRIFNDYFGAQTSVEVTWKCASSRGEDVGGVLHELGLHILNRGETATFDTVRGVNVVTNVIPAAWISQPAPRTRWTWWMTGE